MQPSPIGGSRSPPGWDLLSELLAVVEVEDRALKLIMTIKTSAPIR